MRFKHLLLAFSFVGFACASSTAADKGAEPGPAHAQSASDESSDAKSDDKSDEKKTAEASTPPREGDQDSAPICRYEADIGSNIKKRVCRTREQMAREEREAQEMHRRATRATKVNPN